MYFCFLFINGTFHTIGHLLYFLRVTHRPISNHLVPDVTIREVIRIYSYTSDIALVMDDYNYHHILFYCLPCSIFWLVHMLPRGAGTEKGRGCRNEKGHFYFQKGALLFSKKGTFAFNRAHFYEKRLISLWKIDNSRKRALLIVCPPLHPEEFAPLASPRKRQGVYRTPCTPCSGTPGNATTMHCFHYVAIN